jgi:hypothetical protein
MNLEKRIVAQSHGLSEDPTEIEKLVEAVYLREGAKGLAWWLTSMAASITLVVSAYFFGVYGVNTPWNLMWPTIGLCGVSGGVITWLIYWPFAGRSEYWQDAVDFIEAIQYVESVTGRQFEDWSTLDDGVEKVVENALSIELDAIFSLQEKEPKRASDLFAKWGRRHSQLKILFPSIKDENAMATLATFLPYDQQADSSVHYCSRS